MKHSFTKIISIIFIFIICEISIYNNVFANTLPAKEPEGQLILIPGQDNKIEVLSETINFNIDKECKFANVEVNYTLYNNSTNVNKTYLAYFDSQNNNTMKDFLFKFNGEQINLEDAQLLNTNNINLNGKDTVQKVLIGPRLEPKSTNFIMIKFKQLSGTYMFENSEFYIPEKLFFYYFTPNDFSTNYDDISITVNIPDNYKILDINSSYELINKFHGVNTYNVKYNNLIDSNLRITLHFEPWYFLGINTKEDIKYLIYTLSLLFGFLWSKFFNIKQVLNKNILYFIIYLLIVALLCPFKNIFLNTNEFFHYIQYLFTSSILTITGFIGGKRFKPKRLP